MPINGEQKTVVFPSQRWSQTYGVRIRREGRSLAITEPQPGASSGAFFCPQRMLCIASGWFRIGVSCVIERMSV